MFRFQAVMTILVTAGVFGFSSSDAQAQVLQDFESVVPGTSINGFPSEGVSFGTPLEAVRCDANPAVRGDSNCVNAASGAVAVRTAYNNEFSDYFYDIRFAELQDRVSVKLRYDGSALQNGRPIRVVMSAVGEDGEAFQSTTVNFEHQFDDGEWQELAVSESLPIPSLGIAGKKIAAVWVFGGVNFFPPTPPDRTETTNYLLVDDLSYTSSDPLPEDNLAPVITRFEVPSMTTVISLPIDLRVEERGPIGVARLDTVDIRVEDDDGALVIDYDDGNLCGNATAGPCPELVYESPDSLTVNLDPMTGGFYLISVRACDVSGNCTTDNRPVDYEPEAAPPSVRSHWMEINQGTQSQAGFVRPAQSDIRSIPSGGPYLPDRDTLIRFYLTATGAPRAGYTEEMVLKVWRADGSVPSYRLAPNTRNVSVDIEVDPLGDADRRQLALSQRPDLSKTLNFVIPSELTTGATMFSVRLGQFETTSDPVTGENQIALSPSTTLGIIPIEITGTGFVPATAENLQQGNDILRAQFPISGDVLYPNMSRGEWASETGSSKPHILKFATYPGRGRDRECGDVLSWTRTLFCGDAETLRSTLANPPDTALVMGLVGDGIIGCAGIAYRPGITSVSEVDHGKISMVHEAGHSLGLKHAGTEHGEADGGETEPPANAHGHVSFDGIETFGVVLDQTNRDTIAGRWRATLIDPCLTDPSDDLSLRVPSCALAEDAHIMHDFMSYQDAPGWTAGIPTGSNVFKWISKPSVRRIYDALRFGPEKRLSSTDAKGAKVAALIVAGKIDRDGNLLKLEPLVRKILPPSALTASTGDHVIQLFDAGGSLLLEHGFVAESNNDENADRNFWAAFADTATGATEVRIRDADDELIGTYSASENPPSVTVLAPNGGETIGTGMLTVRWQADDADGDALHYLVQISADGGQNWQGLALTEAGADPSITLSIDGVFPSDQSIVRVIASDGFHTAMDDSDGAFRVPATELIFQEGFE